MSETSQEQASEARFVTLETKVAYQEKTIADLNDVVVDLARALEKLERRARTLEQQLESVLSHFDHPPEKPPHY